MSRVCHGAITDTTVTDFSNVDRHGFLAKSEDWPVCFVTTITEFHRQIPTDPDRSRRATTLVPVFPNRCSIHRVLIRIGSKFSLSIALSFQFPLFQESETPFFWHIHGGFVYVVQLKLKEAKSGNFIHFIIRHKTLFCVSGLYSAWINMAVVSNAITQSQEYISFRSTVPLRRVGVGKRCN